jgi:ABC-2 type transport system permease protein
MRLALAHARAETVGLARYTGYSVPTVAFPAVMLLLFGGHFERGEPDRLFAGFAATALLTVAFFQFGVGIATNRATPWEAYLRTLPAGPATRLAGRVISALAFAATTVAAVALVAFGVYDVQMAPWRVVALGAALLVGSIPFALLGIAFGYWLSPRAALPVANLLYLPLAVGGFLWMRPNQDVPHDVDVASQLLPTRSWMEVLDPIATGDHGIPPVHVAALAAWGGLFFALAWWGYRRDEGERFT